MATVKKAAAKPADEEVQAEVVLDEPTVGFTTLPVTVNPDGEVAGPSSVTAVVVV